MVKFPCVAQIVNTHGLRGEVKVIPLCDEPSDLKKIGEFCDETGKPFLKLRSLRGAGGVCICSFDGIDTVEKALLYKGKYIYAERERIPVAEGHSMICDLIGLPVVDASTGRNYGRIKDVITGVASDIYVIDTDAGEVLFPVVSEFIEKVDESDAVYIRPIPGFFNEK
ncbi:MAG: 16S rRNA processing protein RimM [Clostridia bacterium]|nr:16S rRNA processing protein RimM [Clostridia bacterium]